MMLPVSDVLIKSLYRINGPYTANRSLGRSRDDIAGHLDRVRQGRDVDYQPDAVTLWPELNNLFDLIDSGQARYGVPAYNGGLFDPDQNPFLATKTLPDRYLARIIDQLGRTDDPQNPDRGLFRVDYRDLAIQHLGNVYEGLLELRPSFATEKMIVVRKASGRREEERVIAETVEIPEGYEATESVFEPGSIYLTTDKGERRATGSYYTPDHIVDHIVQHTLGPVCEQIDQQLSRELEQAEAEFDQAVGDQRQAIQSRLDTLRSDFDDRILRLRVLDPAMGSGHFLIRACQYLAEQIATNPNAKDPAAAQLQGDEPTLVFWKRKVVEGSLYGVDKNNIAVELAKLALWLETVAINQPLTFLDSHLRHGDSLVGAKISQLGSLPDAPALLANVFEDRVRSRMPSLLQTLAAIRQTPSETIQQVRDKTRLYRRTFEPTRSPLRDVANAWCSTFYLPRAARLGLEQYRDLLDNLDRPARLRALFEEEPYKSAIVVTGKNGVAAFHWQLEFPEVFFNDSGPRPDAGFDAIIGNPPYEQLSELESGQDLSGFRSYLEYEPHFAETAIGKTNLYQLFISQALSLLCDNGLLGFITPMTLLGDKQASGTRRQMFRTGTIRAIEAFPQKDDARRRVFKEAKLSTVLFIAQKTTDEAARQAKFRSRIHPANVVVADSPAISLSAAEIPLYDPMYLGIASCSQADWDLAVKIKRRFSLLGDLATSFQGEVNETNERRRNTVSHDASFGPEVIRGAHIGLYAIREASQGQSIYLRIPEFYQSSSDDSKATHHQYQRVGFQRKSPQNNFRRLIAAPVPIGTFLLESVSYVPSHHSQLPLEIVLAVLNSKLADWYFRLGSTNAMVSEYQVNNLPCPSFAPITTEDVALLPALTSSFNAGRYEEILEILKPLLTSNPFIHAVQDVLVMAVRRLTDIENSRVGMARSDRSELDHAAAKIQALIDNLFYSMAGMDTEEATALERRLASML